MLVSPSLHMQSFHLFLTLSLFCMPFFFSCTPGFQFFLQRSFSPFFPTPQLNLYALHPRSWLSVFTSLLCSTAHISVFYLLHIGLSLLPSIFFVRVSYRPFEPYCYHCKINVLPSMTALHPISCHVSSFPFVTSLFFVCFSLSSCVLIYFAE